VSLPVGVLGSLKQVWFSLQPYSNTLRYFAEKVKSQPGLVGSQLHLSKASTPPAALEAQSSSPISPLESTSGTFGDFEAKDGDVESSAQGLEQDPFAHHLGPVAGTQAPRPLSTTAVAASGFSATLSSTTLPLPTTNVGQGTKLKQISQSWKSHMVSMNSG
jgi:hypothetical protein